MSDAIDTSAEVVAGSTALLRAIMTPLLHTERLKLADMIAALAAERDALRARIMTARQEIRHRHTGAVLFAGDFATLRECVEAAREAGANLAFASLADANLDGANLADANLAGANLADANLARANLAAANLDGANLAGANLDGAYLACANLARANLAGAKLRDGCTALAAPARRAPRSGGYEFFLWPTDKGWRIAAGCRWFTLAEARHHWERTRRGTPLGDETLDILTMFELEMGRTANVP